MSATAVEQNTTIEEQPVKAVEPSSKKTKVILVYVAVALCVIVAMYYCYQRFMKNSDSSEKESSDSEEKTSDNVIADYNLQEEIDRIHNRQNALLKTLSDDCGI